MLWISRFSSFLRAGEAQATVEAAMLLPCFLTLLLLALQPVCLLYTRSLMEAAAAETVRLVATNESAGDDVIEAFAQRRLAAVPDIEIFHVGGPLSWEIDFTRGKNAKVSISGSVRPLPVLGAFAGAFVGLESNGTMRLEVSVSYKTRPAWLEGKYESWISVWG